MAPHTPIFKPNAALTAPEIQRLSGFGCAGPYRYLVPLNLPADACTASKSSLMGLDGERARGWSRIVACLSQTLPRGTALHVHRING
jgi:hypothetical protein